MTNSAKMARALDEARRKAGLSYSAVLRELWERLGEYAIGTVEGLRNYHRPESFPARPDAVQIAALCAIYKVKLEDVAPEIGEMLDALNDSFGRDAWLSTPV